MNITEIKELMNYHQKSPVLLMQTERFIDFGICTMIVQGLRQIPGETLS